MPSTSRTTTTAMLPSPAPWTRSPTKLPTVASSVRFRSSPGTGTELLAGELLWYSVRCKRLYAVQVYFSVYFLASYAIDSGGGIFSFTFIKQKVKLLYIQKKRRFSALLPPPRTPTRTVPVIFICLNLSHSLLHQAHYRVNTCLSPLPLLLQLVPPPGTH